MSRLKLTNKYKYIPAKIQIKIPLYIANYQKRSNLILAFPPKSYAIPANARFLIHPSVLGKIPEKSRYISISEKDVLVGIRIVQDVSITKYGFKDSVLEILVLPLKKPTKVKYRLLVISFKGKSTGVGASERASSINADPFFTAVTSSRTGNHWKGYYFYLVPVNKKLVFHYIRVSNRGNWYETLYDEEGNEIPRFQETVVEQHAYCDIVKIRDNLKNEEYEAVKLYLHEARRTSAYTSYKVKKGKLELVSSDYHPDKTHWTEIHRILEKPIEIEITRVSNRGNKSTYTITYS